MCVALAALDATIHIQSTQGERVIPFEQFYLVPDNHPHHETVLENGELITAIGLPVLAFAQSSTYIKVRDRASYAFAIVSVAAALDIQDGKIRHARIALGGVATKPWRAYDAEYALVGQSPTQDSYRNAATIAMQSTVTHKDNVELAQRMIVYALERVGASV
jgi:xanthine dehydrogenase YagS FAD-binding subunit